MAKKKDLQENSPRGGPVAVAATTGKVSTPVGVTPQTKSMKVPKLAKKDKARLPRRQKKALQKADQL